MGRGYVAVTSALISCASGDSSLNGTALFGAFLADDWVAVSGSTKAGNNGLKKLATASASKLTTTTALTTEAAGAIITVALAYHIDKVRAALMSRLATMPGLPALVVAENAAAAPAQGTAHLRTYLLPALPGTATIAEAGYSQLNGIFQVSVFVPADQGPGYSDRLATAIANHFKRGTTLTAGGVSVLCMVSGPSPAQQEAHWYHVPVRVTWWTTTTEM